MSGTMSTSNAMHQETGCTRQKEASRDFHRRPRRARHLLYRPRWWWEGKASCIIQAVELVQCSHRPTGPGALRWPSPQRTGMGLGLKVSEGRFGDLAQRDSNVTTNGSMARSGLRHVVSAHRCQLASDLPCNCSGVVCMTTFSYDTRSSLPPVLPNSLSRPSLMQAFPSRWCRTSRTTVRDMLTTARHHDAQPPLHATTLPKSCFGSCPRIAHPIYEKRFDLPGRHTSIPWL